MSSLPLRSTAARRLAQNAPLEHFAGYKPSLPKFGMTDFLHFFLFRLKISGTGVDNKYIGNIFPSHPCSRLPDGHGSDLFRAFFYFKSTKSILENPQRAGPSDGKKISYPPTFHLALSFASACVGGVPPYSFCLRPSPLWIFKAIIVLKKRLGLSLHGGWVGRRLYRNLFWFLKIVTIH